MWFSVSSVCEYFDVFVVLNHSLSVHVIDHDANFFVFEHFNEHFCSELMTFVHVLNVEKTHESWWRFWWGWGRMDIYYIIVQAKEEFAF